MTAFKQFDTDQDDMLTEEDFVGIYKSKAQTHRGQHVVWENLDSQGWGHDLRPKSGLPARRKKQGESSPRYCERKPGTSI